MRSSSLTMSEAESCGKVVFAPLTTCTWGRLKTQATSYFVGSLWLHALTLHIFLGSLCSLVECSIQTPAWMPIHLRIPLLWIVQITAQEKDNLELSLDRWHRLNKFSIKSLSCKDLTLTKSMKVAMSQLPVQASLFLTRDWWREKRHKSLMGRRSMQQKLLNQKELSSQKVWQSRDLELAIVFTCLMLQRPCSFMNKQRNSWTWEKSKRKLKLLVLLDWRIFSKITGESLAEF